MSSNVEPQMLDGPRVCGIADALGLVGDRWSLLVLRELAFGVRRFTDIRRHTGAPREILTARLRKLEAEGLIARRRYSERPPRDEYLLTEAGQALGPVLGALRQWGERYGHGSPAHGAPGRSDERDGGGRDGGGRDGGGREV